LHRKEGSFSRPRLSSGERLASICGSRSFLLFLLFPFARVRVRDSYAARDVTNSTDTAPLLRGLSVFPVDCVRVYGRLDPRQGVYLSLAINIGKREDILNACRIRACTRRAMRTFVFIHFLCLNCANGSNTRSELKKLRHPWDIFHLNHLMLR